MYKFKCFTVVENVTTTMIIPELKSPTFGTDNLTNAQGVLKKYRGHLSYENVPWDIAGNGRLSLPQPLPLEASEKTSTRWLDGEGKGNTD